MLVFMPFTYLDDALVQYIFDAIGPFDVCQIGDRFLPAHLEDRMRQGSIHVRYINDLDQDRLYRTLKEFQQWGELHEGQSATLAGYYAGDRIRGSKGDDPSPTRISHLIRQYEKEKKVTPDRLFQAALFQAIAQVHDEQQAAVNGRWTAVRQMETKMMSDLTGDVPDDANEPSAMTHWRDEGIKPSSSPEYDPGQYFPSQRIEAWAVTARHLPAAAPLYFSTSDIVFDSLLERLPAAVEIGRIPLPETAVTGGKAGAASLISILEAMATASDLEAIMTKADIFSGTLNHATLRLRLLVVPGKRPCEVLAALSKSNSIDPWPQSPICHTILGHIGTAL